ncbi:MAG: hypothetical protein NWR36_02765, partial [Opitutales bacterium]|nr:hypothetical protein [Opitutales bacterium]
AQVFAMLVAAYVSTVAASVSLGMMIEESLFASYAVVGVLEAVLSVAVFAACIRLKDTRTGISVHARVAPIAVAGLIALGFVPFSSQLPDALEKTLEAPIGLVD